MEQVRGGSNHRGMLARCCNPGCYVKEICLCVVFYPRKVFRMECKIWIVPKVILGHLGGDDDPR